MSYFRSLTSFDTNFESFTYPFFDLTAGIDGAKLAELFLSSTAPARPTGKRGLYIHIPFCETICGFCPFVKFVAPAERVERYLTALHIEIKRLAQTTWMQQTSIQSIYLGGGTPSLLSEQQLTDLVNLIKKEISVCPNAEWSFEVEAKSMTESKVRTAAELGFTRVSFGVQTLNPELRKMVNLTASEDQIFQLVNWLNKYIPNNNFDFLVGYPGQSIDQALEDVAYAAKSGIASISLYPLDYTMILPALHQRMKEGTIPVAPSAEDRFRMFYASRKLLAETFNAVNIYSYGKPWALPCTFMFELVYGSYHNEYVGVGCSAYSSLKGLMFQNDPSETEYIKKVLSGDSAVKTASMSAAYEKSLVFFPKHTKLSLNEYRKLRLDAIYDEKLTYLKDQEFITYDSQVDEIRLTKKGELHYASLMVFFMSDSQRRLYTKVCDRFRKQGLIEDSPAPRVRNAKYGALTAMGNSRTTNPATAQGESLPAELLV